MGHITLCIAVTTWDHSTHDNHVGPDDHRRSNEEQRYRPQWQDALAYPKGSGVF